MIDIWECEIYREYIFICYEFCIPYFLRYIRSEKEKINVVLPLQEDELNLIAENRRRFEDRGILAVVSPVEVLNLCRDKYAFYKYMKGKGTAVLPTYDSISDFEKAFSDHEIEFPVFVKPVRGAGSIGAMKVTCMEVLKALFEHSEEPLPDRDGEEQLASACWASMRGGLETQTA